MKKFIYIAAAFLALSACSKAGEENTATQEFSLEQPDVIPFRATLGAPTKAIVEDANNLRTSWAVGDELAMYYKYSITGFSGEFTKKTKVTVQSVDGEGRATVSGTVLSTAKNNSEVRLLYPYDASETGDPYAIKSDWIATQNGALNGDGSIEKKFDMRSGTGTLSVTGETAGLSGNASLTNHYAIFKFTIKNASGSETIDIDQLKVYYGDNSLCTTVTPATATSELYVALPAVTDQLVLFEAHVGENWHGCCKPGVSFEKGQYYQSTLKMEELGSQGDKLVHYISRSWETDKVVDQYKVARAVDISTVTVTSGKATLAASTKYYVQGTADKSDVRFLYNNGSCIILMDGAQLTFKEIHEVDGKSNNHLSIYGQSEGTGRLTSTVDSGEAVIGTNSGSSVTFHGGIVQVANNNGEDGDGPAIGPCANRGDGGSITILGGSVTATTQSRRCAAIGGRVNFVTGAIRIYGGTVVASGKGSAIGNGRCIGDGNSRVGGDVYIYGGNVTARAGGSGAGIGGQYNDRASSVLGLAVNYLSSITISGGTVRAYGYAEDTKDSWAYHDECKPVGIGHVDGTISITGGDVEAWGAKYGAGIGAYTTNLNINISGGIVKAYGGTDAAGIGGSEGAGDGITINISGGAVTAYGYNELYDTRHNSFGSGIGGGEDFRPKAITISGGEVSAYGGRGAAAIGGGGSIDNIFSTSGDSGDITITGGQVYAEAYDLSGDHDTSGIGPGYGEGDDTKVNSITISGGTVTAKGGGDNGVGIGKKNDYNNTHLDGAYSLWSWNSSTWVSAAADYWKTGKVVKVSY